MAFPVPNHLPRKPLPTDVSSQILTTISDTSNKALTAELAAGWVSELQLSIQQTKDRIYDRIYEKLPDFERQLESSKSTQTRFRNLSSTVDNVSDAVGDTETGILPTLLITLRDHKQLAQRAEDARVTFEALSYLNECRLQFENLAMLATSGNIPGGVNQSISLSQALEDAPQALARAEIMNDMKNELRMLKDRMEEQLNEAFSRAIQLSSTELRICPTVHVRGSQTLITLQGILSSLSMTSLNSLLASLRRDIVSHFIEFPLQQSVSSGVSRDPDANGTPSIALSIFPLPPSPVFQYSSLDNIRTLFHFLRENLFPVLPPSVATSFWQSLYKPTTTAILRDLLVPSIPSSLSDLTVFLSLVQDTVRLEEDYYHGDGLRGEELLDWARGVAGHYGRKRRLSLLAEVRKLILSDKDGRPIRVEVSQPPEDLVTGCSGIIPVQGDIDGINESKDGWDFEDDVKKGDMKRSKSSGTDENGRNFDDINEAKPEDEATDESDAWGWGDGENDSTLATSEDDNAIKPLVANTNGHEVDKTIDQTASEDSAWDSAWDEAEPQPAQPTPSSPSQPVSPAKAPKIAKRLEKLSAKGKGKASPALSPNPPSSTFSASSAFSSNVSSSTHSFSSPLSQSAFSPTLPPQSVQTRSAKPQLAQSKPPVLQLPQKPKEPETHLISGRVKDLVYRISETLSEGNAIASSSILSDFPLTTPESINTASSLVLQAAPSALDVYRAVYPVAYGPELLRSARAFRFANDCSYLHEEVRKLEIPAGASTSVHEQMREAQDRLHALSVWWFDEGIERECERVQQILSRAEGFVDSGDQERFDECESVMSEVLRDVRTATREWKTILPRTKWLRATGRVVETALARVLSDVLALPDIPELDSRRLSELCRILNSLEGLFVDAEDPDAPSMVLAYVSSWLKYSYLSELLEASIADVSYLFDEGALIDFSVDELVRLVRALFADTPLRANTIAKLQRGHPLPVE